jgi:ADP-ribose pyrophosphatase YjhB (NUDIX family)
MWRSYPGAGILALRDRHVLMVLHVRSGKTRWELPSGFVEPGETFEQAAVRETMEETAVSVVAGPLLCTAVMDVPCDEYRGINTYFIASSVGDEVPKVGQGELIVQAEFVDLSTIRSRDIHPVDRYILAHWKKHKTDKPFYFRMRF